MQNAALPRRLLVAGLALLTVGAAPAQRRTGATPKPSPPPFEQNIDVVETSVLVTPPAGLHFIADRDWQVRENDVVRKVERVEELRDEPWQLVVWVDGPLCDQAALPRTLLALAHQAEVLTRLGTVRVVAAAPTPTTVLEATREPAAVVRALAALSAQTPCSGQPDTLFWQARGMPRGGPINPALATPAAAAAALADLRSLVERRAAMLADALPACPAAGCAVLLVSHGYPLDADLRLPAALRPANAEELATALAAANNNLARRLAVARWLVIALPFAAPPPVGEPSEADSTIPPGARPGPEPFPRGNDNAPPGAPAPIRHLPAIAPPAVATDVYLLPELAPLRRLAMLTTGLMLRVPEQLPPALDSFANRRRLWYRTTPFAAGDARPLEVTVRGHRADAPAWVGLPPSP